MKLLVVSPNLPGPTFGAGARNYYLLKALASKHTVSLLALVNKADLEVYDSIPVLEKLISTVKVVYSPERRAKRLDQLLSVIAGRSYVLQLHTLAAMQAALDTCLAHDHYDAILFESVLITNYRLPEGMKVVIDQHNIEYELLQRTYQQEKAWIRKWYNWRESRLLKPIEIEHCRQATGVLVTSERERLIWKRMLPQSVIEVVPNGVDLEYFCGASPQEEVAHRVIFTGNMNYYPNVDAVLFFAHRCWPLIREHIPDASWQIVGRDPLPEVQGLAELPGVTVTGSVPETRSYLASAAVAIAPLLIGSGTRLKILEALAMQKAVVSTSLGCEGLSVEAGKHLLVADQAEAFAQAVITLLCNPEQRIALGTAGRALVEAEYSWERCGNQLLQALEKMNIAEGEHVC